jgi:hypothetical protein
MRSIAGDCSRSRTLSDLAIAGSGLGAAGAAPRERGRLIPEREMTIAAPWMLAALMAGMMR